MTRAEIEARLEAISPGGFFADQKRVEILTTELRSLYTALLESMDRTETERRQREAAERDKDDAMVRAIGAEGAAWDLIAAIGETAWFRHLRATRLLLPPVPPANPSEAPMSVKFDDTRATPEPGGLNLTPEKRAMAAAYKGSINHGQLPEPVAPTPSPDIAGLVERLTTGVVWTGNTEDGEYELYDIEEAEALMFEAATALQRVAQERDALQHEVDKVQHWQARADAAEARIATAEADTARWIARVSEIREASGLGGGPMLTDLAEAIRTRIATARDEGLEMAAAHLDPAYAHVAAAIRELKGQPK